VDNVLFTGGDPASFRKTRDLTNLIGRLFEHDKLRVVRFATKGLAYDPERFMDGELLYFFKDINEQPNKQVSVIAQINHPGEMGEKSVEALRQLRGVGVQVRGQPAIIKGVNDSVETLIDLQRKFLDNHTPKGKEPPKGGTLDDCLLIVDEAHNLFNAITNGSKNAVGLYDLILKAKNLKRRQYSIANSHKCLRIFS